MARYGTYNTPGAFKLTVYGIVIAASFLIMFYLVRGLFRDENPGRVNSARADERIKVRRELQEKAVAALNNGGVIDTNKGIIRLPINRAMEMTVQAYGSPEAARSNLIARAKKAAEPAPAAPEQPSPFE